MKIFYFSLFLFASANMEVFRAIQEGDTAKVRQLLLEGADMNAQGQGSLQARVSNNF